MGEDADLWQQEMVLRSVGSAAAVSVVGRLGVDTPAAAAPIENVRGADGPAPSADRASARACWASAYRLQGVDVAAGEPWRDPLVDWVETVLGARLVGGLGRGDVVAVDTVDGAGGGGGASGVQSKSGSTLEQESKAEPVLGLIVLRECFNCFLSRDSATSLQLL